MEKILILGVNGFSGQHLVRIIGNGTKPLIYGFDIHPQAVCSQDIHDYSKIDILNYSKLNSLIKKIKPHIIYNLTGLNDGPPTQIYKVNFMGAINLLEAIKESSPGSKALFVGSAAEYGLPNDDDLPVKEDFSCQPTNTYGLSKYAATLAIIKYVKQNNVKAVIARPFNIIGTGIPSTLFLGAIIDRIKKKYFENEKIIIRVGNLMSERDFIDIEDVVQGYRNLVKGNHWGEIFNICSGKPTQIKHILDTLSSFSKKEIFFEVDENLVNKFEVKSIFGNNEKAHKTFGFLPRI